MSSVADTAGCPKPRELATSTCRLDVLSKLNNIVILDEEKFFAKTSCAVCQFIQGAHAFAFRSYLGRAKGTWRNLLPIVRHPGRTIRSYVTNIDRVVNIPMLIPQCAVVSHAGHYVWARVSIRSEFSGWVILDQNLIPDVISMRDSLRVLDLIILIDAMLFLMPDGFPIRMKLHIQYGIAAKH